MYYDGANWKWGDEMNQRVFDKWCGHKFYTDHCGWCQETFDISLSAAKRFANYCAPVEKKEPCHHWGRHNNEEKKEQRKLSTILLDAYREAPTVTATDSMPFVAEAAIDAVIECYEEWEKSAKATIKYSHGSHIQTFPEYLKEKML